MPDPQDRLAEMVEGLRKRGCRITPQRMAVLETLVTSEEHLSVEQIYDRVRADFPMTSLATIYKTITLLKEMNQVLELGFGDDSNHYDGNRPQPHPHLICVRCRRIIDLDIDAVSVLPQEVEERTGYRIVNHRLDFFGLCPQCQEEANS
jgi:Fur family peroxide stress response transcriptional regulator